MWNFGVRRSLLLEPPELLEPQEPLKPVPSRSKKGCEAVRTPAQPCTSPARGSPRKRVSHALGYIGTPATFFVRATTTAFGECSVVCQSVASGWGQLLAGSPDLLFTCLPIRSTAWPASGSLGQLLLVPGSWTPGPARAGTLGPRGAVQGPRWVSHSTSQRRAPWWPHKRTP
ncbi:hypothetical protein NDU88_001010 [Pleurodeles waltl]|uniref:Uncharacterized protein n=1 Tax=Pleurodeles waltl TaxID=8319 RepID=A0AAV7UUT9_PLEWA|nr:hypothetical protein NDU88_001010 [Pleurodeles waltl]